MTSWWSAAWLGLAVVRALPAQQSERAFDISLRPVRDSTGRVTAVLVRQVIDRPLPAPGPFSIRAAIVYAGTRGSAETIEGLRLRDARGDLPVRVRDDRANAGGFPYYRHWVARRGVAYPITVTYRFRIPTDVPTVGPQFDARASAGGFSSSGVGFLTFPDASPGRYVTRVHWDLGALDSGSTATSTFGEGVDIAVRGTVDRAAFGYFMVGRQGRYPPAGSDSGVVAYWLGTPPFDAEREMAWTARMSRYLHGFFRDTSSIPFRVFLRPLSGLTGFAATTLDRSFMFAMPTAMDSDSTRAAPRETITHEMVHYWTSGLAGDGGRNAWFNEGVATFYARLLAMRSALMPVDSFLQSVNATARNYYTHPLKNLSLDSLHAIGFSMGVGPRSAQIVPYLRGSFYFAYVDARIRTASGGGRRLDDVLVPFFARLRADRSSTRDRRRIDTDAFVGRLVAELGPSARRDFEAIIVRGEDVLPPSDAFGPCFRRESARFIVRGQEMSVPQWIRVPSVPDDQCRAW